MPNNIPTHLASKHLVLIPGTWYLVPGAWYMVLGPGSAQGNWTEVGEMMPLDFDDFFVTPRQDIASTFTCGQSPAWVSGSDA